MVVVLHTCIQEFLAEFRGQLYVESLVQGNISAKVACVTVLVDSYLSFCLYNYTYMRLCLDFRKQKG